MTTTLLPETDLEHSLVYRLETPDQLGVYSAGRVPSATGFEPGRHPAPWEDGLGRETKAHEYFGFRDTRQLLDWFDAKDLRIIDRYNRPELVEGYAGNIQLTVIRVPNAAIRSGRRQVVFDNNTAERLMTLPLDPDLLESLAPPEAR